MTTLAYACGLITGFLFYRWLFRLRIAQWQKNAEVATRAVDDLVKINKDTLRTWKAERSAVESMITRLRSAGFIVTVTRNNGEVETNQSAKGSC